MIKFLYIKYFFCVLITILSFCINAQNKGTYISEISLYVPVNDTAYTSDLSKAADDLYQINLDSSAKIWGTIIKISNHFLSEQDVSPKNHFFYLTALADAQNNLGYFYKTHENISKAIECYHSSLRLFEKINEKEGLSSVLNNISLLYLSQNEDDKALEYQIKALKIQEEINDIEGIAISLSNIGQIYYRKKDFQKAFSFFDRSLTVERSINNKEGEAYGLINIGQACSGLEQFSNAIIYFKKSFDYFTETGNKKGMAYALNHLSVVQYKAGNISEAIISGQASLKLSRELNLPDYIKRAARALHLIYAKQDNYKLALEMHELYIQMRDSLNNDINRKAILSAEIKYEYDKKTIADSVKLAGEKEINALLLKEEQSKKQATLVGLLMVSLFAIITFNRFKITRHQKSVIEQQKMLVEEKQKEILDSISYAKRLQEAILPPDKMWRKYLPNSFVYYKPKDIVAGDFYWMETDGDTVLFAVADCTGHGVPGAMVSVVCSNAMNRAVKEFNLRDPGKILFKVRELVIETFEKSESEVKDGMDISLCCLNKKTNELLWAGANNPLWIIQNKALTELTADKQPIGKYTEEKEFTTHRLNLEKGSSLFLFTDGYADQFGGPKGKKFKYKALQNLILQHHHDDPKCQLKILDLALVNWMNRNEQVDDICIIGVMIS